MKEQQQPKIGSGALQAAARQGLKEIGAALKPFPDSIQVDELGTVGNPTPYIVTSQMTGKPGKQIDMDMDR